MSDAHQVHAAKRDRALVKTVAATIGAKGFSVVCTLVQVPIALRYLGTESYGVWIVLVTLFGLLNFFDFGIGVAMQQAMARANATGETARMQRQFATGTLALAAVGAALAFAGFAALPFVDLPEWFRVGDPAIAGELRPALALTFATFALGVPLNAASRLAAALQRGWEQALWNAIGGALLLAAIGVAVALRAGLLGFVAAATVVPLCQNIGLWCALHRRLDWRIWTRPRFDAGEWPALRRTSALFTAPQIGAALVGTMPALAINVAGGPAAVTAFNLLQRIFGSLLQVQSFALTPLWPAFAEAHERGDLAWMRRRYRQSIALTLAGAGALAVAALAMPRLLELWLGSAKPELAPAFAWAGVAWFSAQMLGQVGFSLLAGVGDFSALARHGTLGAAGAVLGLWLGARLGGPALALALGGLGYGAGALPGMFLASARSLRQPPPDRF